MQPERRAIWCRPPFELEEIARLERGEPSGLAQADRKACRNPGHSRDPDPQRSSVLGVLAENCTFGDSDCRPRLQLDLARFRPVLHRHGWFAGRSTKGGTDE